jgi:TonB-linked SusC/RagA family outer membrane protein
MNSFVPLRGIAHSLGKNLARTVALMGFVCALLLGASLDALAQARNGKITDATSGKAIGGVRIVVKGSNTGAFTKPDGTFSINAPDGAVLVIATTGFKKKEVKVEGGDIVIKLSEDIMQLEELVVTAIGVSQQKKSLGYAVQEVKGESMVQARETNLVSALASRVAGVQITNSSGAAGGSAFVQIRGAISITGQNQPLFIIDGLPLDNSQNISGANTGSVAFSNRAVDINPSDIESISVLKGPAATALYGLQAAGGAIVITTKRGREGASAMNVNFSSMVGIDNVNKLPELQNTYAQGLGGVLGSPDAAVAGTRFRSWGPAVADLRLVDDADYQANWDKNGRLVTMADPRWASGRPARTYDPYSFFQTGTRFENNLSVNGSNQNGSYFASFGQLRQNGIVPNNYFDRFTARVGGSYQLSSNLKVNGSMNYIRSGGVRIEQGSNTSGVMLGLTRTPPTFDLANGSATPVTDRASYRLPNGLPRSFRGINQIAPNIFTSGFDNPYWTVNENPLRDQVDRLIVSFETVWNPVSWMDVVWRVGRDGYEDRRAQRFAIGSATFPAGRVFEDQFSLEQFNSDFLVTMRGDITEDIKAEIMLGQNAFSRQTQNIYIQGDGIAVPEFYSINNTTTVVASETLNRLRRLAVYGEARFRYKEMVYLNVRGRNEWTTVLNPNNNSFFTYGGDLGFVFTELLQTDAESVLPFGKLNFSVGTVGADGALEFAGNTLWNRASFADGWTNTQGIQFPIAGSAGFSQSANFGNPNLRPESGISFEAGFNLKFYRNRFGIDATYYQDDRSNLILQAPTARSSGFGSSIVNAARMRNEGVEVVLNARPIEIPDAGFNWDIQLNWSRNVNNVVALAPNVTNIFLVGFAGTSSRAVAGEQYGTIFGRKYLRTSEGRLIINDDRNSPTFGFPAVDPTSPEVPLGRVVPDWIAGMRNTFTFQNASFGMISLAIQLDVRQGGSMWNGTLATLDNYGTSKRSVEFRERNNYVFDGVGRSTATRGANGTFTGGQPNTVAIDRTARPTAWQNWLLGDGGGFGTIPENHIESTSWFRIREANLTYALPSSAFDGGIVKSASIFVSGRNLFLSTPFQGIDPETNLTGATNGQGLEYYNMPNTRSFNFGINIGF